MCFVFLKEFGDSNGDNQIGINQDEVNIENNKSDDAKGKNIYLFIHFYFLNLIFNQFYCDTFKLKFFRDRLSDTSYSICQSKQNKFIEQFDSSQFFGAIVNLLAIIEECYTNGKYH